MLQKKKNAKKHPWIRNCLVCVDGVALARILVTLWDNSSASHFFAVSLECSSDISSHNYLTNSIWLFGKLCLALSTHTLLSGWPKICLLGVVCSLCSHNSKSVGRKESQLQGKVFSAMSSCLNFTTNVYVAHERRKLRCRWKLLILDFLLLEAKACDTHVEVNDCNLSTKKCEILRLFFLRAYIQILWWEGQRDKLWDFGHASLAFIATFFFLTAKIKAKKKWIVLQLEKQPVHKKHINTNGAKQQKTGQSRPKDLVVLQTLNKEMIHCYISARQNLRRSQKSGACSIDSMAPFSFYFLSLSQLGVGKGAKQR